MRSGSILSNVTSLLCLILTPLMSFRHHKHRQQFPIDGFFRFLVTNMILLTHKWVTEKIEIVLTIIQKPRSNISLTNVIPKPSMMM